MCRPPPAPPASTLDRVSAALHDAIRSRLWPVPLSAVVLAVVLGVALPLLDAAIDQQLPGWMTGVVFGGGSSAARDVLGAVAGAVMTVTSLTFSLTVVTLQLASNQFSPRLLRTFTGDGVVQATLALFLGTFTYSLIVLRTVRDRSDAPDWVTGGEQFVPRVAVTLSVILAVGCVVALIGFLAHLTKQIRVEPVLQAVHEEGSATLTRVAPAADADLVPVLDGTGSPVPSRLTGFVTVVDERRLLRLADEHDLLVDVTASPGAAVLQGAPAARLYHRDGRPLTAADPGLVEAVARTIRVGAERVGSQDPTFALRQILDVVLRALSPGTNDPTTAIHGIGHVSALLCELLRSGPGDALLHGDDDVTRVVLRRPDLTALLDAAVGHVLRYASADPAIARELLVLLTRLAWTRPDDEELLEQLRGRRQQVLDTVLPTSTEQDRRVLEASAGELDRVRDGRWDQRARV
ncbi:DUF2254 domain-containing protein [Kineococcus gynurae]|uniref:DUF2254 domain-containing protein n=1 Tax=Kineococcus gynurae TaxID=452979 RepID=A0ABV5LU22_9ACTN